ncbi:OLC1v1036142C4 [Oldenlandia corymbosa var. corymbosa]|uniref:OLC1v1036142C4 n=1 Tax=Oldenlandia corymbosa var. corymbosa TaxID=529605 RepID=A0AAV1CVQ9_OLDCO|nr:OLC1v1036142C4 [Oldenlandia corymbosa var. corymbosa]
MNSSHGVSSSIVRLNIGGKKFSTTVDTLTHREPESMLGAMFSGRHIVCQEESDKGYIFIDRDGKHFRHILNWLRDGVIPILKDSDYLELLREAEYFQLLGLIDGIKVALSCKKKDDEELGTELTRIDIIKCIQSEKVRFRGVNLSGLDLSKLDLSFVDFSYACLKGVFFSRANLQCAKFRDVDAEASNFHNAALRECEFTGANLRGALLAGANLQSANLQDACLIDCSFCGADLRSAHLQTADLTNANLEGANLEGANLKGAKLYNANLKGANLQRAYLRHVNLRDAEKDGVSVQIEEDSCYTHNLVDMDLIGAKF